VLLLDSVKPEQWKRNQEKHLVSSIFRTRMEEWKSRAQNSEQRTIIELYESNPYELSHNLMQFKVLQSYPSIGESQLGDLFLVFKSLKLQLQDMKIDESKQNEAILYVTYQLNNQKPKDAEEFSILVESMSGLLTVEFDCLQKHLSTHQEWITPECVDQIENKFNNPSRSLAKRISALRSLIRPVKPKYPELNWDVNSMLSWATESYLPYQSWCNAHDQFDPDLFNIGDRFSEWLMTNWDDIHSNSKRMVFNILANKAVELKKPGTVNLVLVVDNLGWAFSNMLSDLFQERGYFLGSAEPYIAMVPSETETSKKCLLSGAVGYQQVDNPTYTAIIEKGWVPYFNDNAFRYISDIGTLGTINSIDAKTYIVNYLAVDKALHKSADEIGMSHQEQVQIFLEKLVENVITFIDKHSLQERIHIHVVSDHGSTRIPKEIPNDLDQSLFKTEGFETLSHRYVTVSNEKFENLADNLKLDCFFLPANDFLNPANVLCARRGNRFLTTDKDSYVHGGLLPEEIIVPYMVFEPAAVNIQNLTLLLKKNEFRYRVETVELEIGNPNDSAAEQIQISFLNGNIESDPIRVAMLNGKTNAKNQYQVRFKQTTNPDEQSNLFIRVRFQIRGEQHAFDAPIKIVMRKMIEEKSTNAFDL
jgi:hypothetical protein